MNDTVGSPDRPVPRFFMGFDLGHGESSFACLTSDRSNGAPDMLKLSSDELNSWPTAYCISPDGAGAEIGEMAIRTAAMNRANQLHMAFKSRPDVNPGAANEMVQYMEIVWRRLAARHEGEVPHNVFVGCPSGWGPPSIEFYQQRMREVLAANPNICHIAIVRESRAAMYQALIESQERNTRESFFSDTLVIDVGSSTADFTAISGQSEIMDRGFDVGAGLIDEAILQHLPGWETDARVARVIREATGSDRALLLSMCRRAKEEYYRSIWRVEDGGPWVCPSEDDERELGQGSSRRHRFPTGSPQAFAVMVQLDLERMKQVLSRGIEAFGGLTWGEKFESVLREVQDELARLKFRTARVVLTGGASKMPMVQRPVRALFSEAEFVPVSDPSTFIAKGLARSCARDYRTGRFRAAIDPLTDKPLLGLVSTHFPQYKRDLARSLADSLIDYAVVPALKEWRSGSIATLDRCEGHIKTRIESWFRCDEPKAIWERQSRDFDTKIKTAWCDLKAVKDACAEFEITYKQLCGGILGRRDGLAGLPLPASITNPAVLIPDLTSMYTLIVGVVVAALIPIVVGLGPVVWIIAGLLAIYGVERLLREQELPRQIRDPMLSDERLSKVRGELVTNVSTELQNKFGNDFNELQAAIGRQIRSEVQDQIDKELRLIR